ncbi:MAG: thiolase family protein [Candidatus Nanopelagicales bacterium]
MSYRPNQAMIVGIGLSAQARRLEGYTSTTAMLEAIQNAVADCGMSVKDIDGIIGRWSGPGGTSFHPGGPDWAGQLGTRLRFSNDTYPQGVPAISTAAAAIEYGLCSTCLVVNGQAGERADGGIAPWTQPQNEFTEPFGSTTPAQFALVARRYQHEYGLDPRDLAYISASIRNYGHINPDAVMYGRGPFTEADILDSPMIADPFHLLDLCMVSEGAAAVILTRADRAQDMKSPPIQILGAGADWLQQQYVNPPVFDRVYHTGDNFVSQMFSSAGVSRGDIDVFQLYDANSFEIIRQFEVLGYAGPGEGASYLREHGLGPTGSVKLNTDGGLMSFSHPGFPGPTIKFVEAVRQLRGLSGDRQVPSAEVALVSGAGSGAQYWNAAILSKAS